MKQQISPAVAAVVILVIALIAGLFVWRGANTASKESEKPPGMPPNVAAEFNRRMGTAAPAGSTAPTGGQPTGGYTAPPSSSGQ